MTEIFTGSFTQQEPIPEAGIEAALDVLRHGRLHRYNVVEGETSHTALLEQEFAAQMGSKYALAVASGGYAIATALRAVLVEAGDRVLTNAASVEARSPIRPATFLAPFSASPALVSASAHVALRSLPFSRI